jgi:hypothetical protein
MDGGGGMSGSGALDLGSRGTLLAAATAVAMTLGSTSAELRSPAAPWTDASGYADRCLAVGATVNRPGGGEPLDLFARADAAMGPLTLRRSFEPSLPRDHASSSAGGDAAAGLRSFVSWKPPNGDVRGATEGDYDVEITAWARSVPRTGVFATSYHEPENDMTAAEFVAFQRRMYAVVKAANPTIRWGPVYMAYWWDPGSPDHWVGDPEAWWPGEDSADFVGLDWYGPEPRPMTQSPSFLTWYETFEDRPVPLFIVEYGQYAVADGESSDPAAEQARADAIRADAAWIAEHPRIRMWLYWQSTGAQGDWRIRDRIGREAWREVAALGCPPTAAAALRDAD